MNKKSNSIISEKKDYILEIVKAVIIALILSLLCVLGLAFIIKIFDLSSTFTLIANQVVKTIAIVVGCVFSLKRKGNGWMRGIICGLLYSITSFIVFSLIGGEFSFDISLLTNCVIGMAIGLIGGIISMAIRN